MHEFMNLLAIGLHAPIVDDLGTPAALVDQRSQKFVHGHLVPGFFQHLALGGIARRFAGIQLALGKHPLIALAQAHHRDQRRLRLPQYNAPRRQNRRPRHLKDPVR